MARRSARPKLRFVQFEKSEQVEPEHRWYDAPKRCGDFYARNNDGLSTHARAYSRSVPESFTAKWKSFHAGPTEQSRARIMALSIDVRGAWLARWNWLDLLEATV